MKHPILILLFIAISMGSIAQEDCENALQVTAGITTVEAITGGEAPAICFSTVADLANWYRYTPDSSMTVTVTTDLTQNGGTDTRVHVYEDDCSELVCIASDDDGGEGFSSTTAFSVEGSESYIIVFDDRWTDSGFDFFIGPADSIPVIEIPEGAFSFSPLTTALSGGPASIVDMNGDHLDDLLGVSGSTVNIGYQLPEGGFDFQAVPAPDPDFSPSWSISAADIDENGRTDLLYGAGQGVTFMYSRDDGLLFEEVSGPEYVFCQRTNFVDINVDGHLDAFSCHDVQPNVYYINDGNDDLQFNQGGIGDTPNGGNYGSIWSDFDNDGDVDLFLSKCRGGDSPANINQLHINDGAGNFTDMAPSAGLADNLLTWSSAVADFDNDGDMDIFVGASSTSNGTHKMMQNNGDLTFSDITSTIGIENHTSTSIEHFAYDFDNDGWVDIYSTSHRILKNNGDMTFTIYEVTPNTGAVGDVNGDGFVDMLNGSTVHLNNGNDNHHITVNLVGTVSNIDGIGARVTVTSALGSQIRDIYSGVGFRYMHSLNAYFGLGADETIESVTVQWPSGIIDVIDDPAIDEPLEIVEGSTVVGIDEEYNALFTVYPTMTSEALNISTQESLNGALMSVFDANGRRVMNGALTDLRIDVSNLAEGSYVLRLNLDGRFVEKQFIKTH